MSEQSQPLTHHGRTANEFKQAALTKVYISALLLLMYIVYAFYTDHKPDLYLALILFTVPLLGLITLLGFGNNIELTEKLLFYLRSYSMLSLLFGSLFIADQNDSFRLRLVFLYAIFYFAYITDFLYVHRVRFSLFVLIGSAGTFVLPVDLNTQFMLLLCIIFMTALGYDTVRLREANARLNKELAETSEDQIYKLSHYDSLTGLPNHILMREIGLQYEKEMSWERTNIAMMAIGLDGFKAINESLGNSVGDQVLRQIAHRIARCTGSEELLARYSGDQFTLAMINYPDTQLIELRAKQILCAISQPLELDGEQLMLTCSIGIAIREHADDSFALLAQHAESAMNEAKLRGKNRYLFFETLMMRISQDRLRIESALRLAVKEMTNFQLVYQPKLNIQTGEVAGAEALIRWNDPNLGNVRPDQFIYIAEKTGLIIPLGYWIFRTAIKNFEILEAEGVELPSLSINLSATQFQDPALLNTLSQILQSTSINPEKIDIELTESAMMNRPDEGWKTLEQLKSQRLSLSIDDFGVAYSSLSYLKRLPADRLKIDRSFIIEITDHVDDQSITSSIIVMGHKLGLKVLAEGVETKEQLEILKEMGCDEIQGFYYAKPLAFDEFKRFLTK